MDSTTVNSCLSEKGMRKESIASIFSLHCSRCHDYSLSVGGGNFICCRQLAKGQCSMPCLCGTYNLNSSCREGGIPRLLKAQAGSTRMPALPPFISSQAVSYRNKVQLISSASSIYSFHLEHSPVVQYKIGFSQDIHLQNISCQEVKFHPVSSSIHF